MPRPCKSYKSSHSTHVERDCGRVVKTLPVAFRERSDNLFHRQTLHSLFTFPRDWVTG